MEPSKREVDEALRPIEADPELAKLMDSAARAAHTSRQMTWQAQVDEFISRSHNDNEICEKCQWIESVKALGAQLATADNAFRQQYHRAELLEVKVANHRIVMVILLAAIGVLVVLRWS